MKKLLNYYLFLILISLHFNPSFVQGMGSYGEGEESSSAGVSTSSAPISTSISSTAPSSSLTSTDRLSPTCRSPVEERCLDARVYRENFEPKINRWIQERKELLLQACRSMGLDMGSRNIALAGIGVFYQENGTLKSTPIIDLDPIFISGDSSSITDTKNRKDINLIDFDGKQMRLSSLEDYLQEDVATIREALRSELNILYQNAVQTTKLNQRALQNWKGNFKNRRKTAYKNPYDSLPLNFFHSEQAIRLHLINNAEIICIKLIESMASKDSIVQYVAIPIATLNEMCRNCAITYFLSSEQKILETIFRRTLEKLNLKVSEDFSVLIVASGLRTFDPPNREYLGRQIQNFGAIISPEIFPPHVVQYFLSGAELEKNQRELDVAETTKVSSNEGTSEGSTP